MKRRVLPLLAVAIGIMPAIAQQAPPQSMSVQQQSTGAERFDASTTVFLPANQSVLRLADIKRITVAPFGSGDGAEIIRQKVINRLIASGVVSVVNSANDADATLTGGVEISHRFSFYMNPAGGFSGGTRRRAEGAVQLIGKHDQTLWTAEKSSRMSFGSASSTVARRIVDSLIAAIEKDRVPTAIKEDTHS